MSEEEVGVMRNAMTTRAPCGAKNTLNPEITLLYHFHAQKAPFKVPKICNINFWIEDDPPPLALFRKFIRFCSLALPLEMRQVK